MESRIKYFGGILAFTLFLYFLALFLFAQQIRLLQPIKAVPQEAINVSTIFLGIILEAIPFILLGVFVSSLIQQFVSEDMVRRVIPKNPILSIFPAALLGLVFPICECAIIPVVRKLIQKGMPLHTGIVFMVSAPILNPVVYLSTYHAFKNGDFIANSRMSLGFISAIIIGFVIFRLFSGRNVLKWSGRTSVHIQNNGKKSVIGVLHHACDEFFDTGKYLFIGAFIASLVQAFLDRGILDSIGTTPVAAPAFMMAFAFILSVCSEADAFVAASFGSSFSPGSLLAFLVLGPMIDIKNTLMLLAYFKKRFAAALLVVIPSIVFIVIQVYQFVLQKGVL